MAENYKRLYETTKKMLARYQDEVVPGLRRLLKERVEVVHAEWVEWYPPNHMILTGEEMLYRCSSCDAKYPDVEGYKYCPYCGAKMDGERRSE